MWGSCRYELWRKSEIRKVRPVQRMLRALGTTLLTLAVLGGLAYGGFKAADGKILKQKAEVRAGVAPCGS